MNSQSFQDVIQYEFKDMALLKKALTHSSYTCRKGMELVKNNERLEFLGDAFFDAIISEELFKRLPDEEGRLSKLRAQIVCERSLARVGNELKIGDYMNMGKGEELSGGRYRDSIVADAMEAIIGAIFLDGGYKAAEEFTLRNFEPVMQEAIEGRIRSDYKSEIQEILQGEGIIDIKYTTDRSEGPDHDKTFFVHLTAEGEVLGQGSGKSKKEAEQHAAREAIERKSRECISKE